jgi:hypothetical protein
MSLYPIFSPVGAAPYPSISTEHSRWRADAENVTIVTGVSVWADISLVGDGDNDLVQATTAEQPVWSATSGPNSTAGITFDGSDDGLVCASGMASIDTKWHFFMIFKNISQTGLDVQVAISNTKDPMRGHESGTDDIAQHLGGASYANHVTCTDGTWFLYDSFIYESSTTSAARLNNGTAVTGEAPGSIGAWTGLRLGRAWNDADEANMACAEFIIFTDQVTGSDLTALMAYFSDYYKLF